jgi:hypothetical protein
MFEMHKIEHFFLEENQFWLCPLQQRIYVNAQ